MSDDRVRSILQNIWNAESEIAKLRWNIDGWKNSLKARRAEIRKMRRLLKKEGFCEDCYYHEDCAEHPDV